jgi:excisionase family DNA binding protein
MNKITIKQACELAQISRPTLYKYINNGLLNVLKDGKNTLIETSELIRVFPDIKLNHEQKEYQNDVKDLQGLTSEITHKDEIILILKKQLEDKQKEVDFLQQQLTNTINIFTPINKLLENKPRKKFLGIF